MLSLRLAAMMKRPTGSCPPALLDAASPSMSQHFTKRRARLRTKDAGTGQCYLQNGCRLSLRLMLQHKYRLVVEVESRLHTMLSLLKQGLPWKTISLSQWKLGTELNVDTISFLLRYTLTEGDFHHLKKARLTHLHLAPPPSTLKILTIMECESTEISSHNVNKPPASKLPLYQVNKPLRHLHLAWLLFHGKKKHSIYWLILTRSRVLSLVFWEGCAHLVGPEL